jgi:hypothetical protein
MAPVTSRPTPCRVWAMYQARCLPCDWAGELTGSSGEAATDARHHRATPEHKQRLRERRAAR